MMAWLQAFNRCIERDEPCVIVCITGVQGSAPRSVGTRMLVSRHAQADTIGGGALELSAINHARAMLNGMSAKACIESHTHTLGKEFSQCCGGKVTLQYDYHPATRFPLVVFGAGHIAQAIAGIVRQLPCRGIFIDPRQQWLDKLPTGAERADSASAITRAAAIGVIEARLLSDNNSFNAVEQCPDAACYLVMTHSHELDFELCEAILSRGDARYCGLVASKSKAMRFRKRLASKGFDETELGQLTAPIGQAAGRGRQPMEIAVATLAEIMAVRNTQVDKQELA